MGRGAEPSPAQPGPARAARAGSPGQQSPRLRSVLHPSQLCGSPYRAAQDKETRLGLGRLPNAKHRHVLGPRSPGWSFGTAKHGQHLPGCCAALVTALCISHALAGASRSFAQISTNDLNTAPVEKYLPMYVILNPQVAQL